MRRLILIAGLVLMASAAGCGIWDTITGNEDDEVMLKGDSGTSCSLDSECRSNSCVYPGICQ